MIRAAYNRLRSLKRAASSRFFRLKSLVQNYLEGGQLLWPMTVRTDVPVRIDGSGSVVLGEGVQLGYSKAPRIGSGEILLQARGRASTILIGPGTATSNNVSIISTESIEIGRECRIGDMTLIMDCDFHEVNPLTRNDSSGQSAPVVLADRVWIGSRAIVLKGVTIGENSVIAAGSVVTRSIPANSLAAGVPARVIREL